jgi:hypothetical protein
MRRFVACVNEVMLAQCISQREITLLLSHRNDTFPGKTGYQDVINFGFPIGKRRSSIFQGWICDSSST